MGLSDRLAFTNDGLAMTVLSVGLPLTVLWAYSLARCLQGGLRHGGAARTGPGDGAPLDDMTWVLLLLLSGWFGALAYLGVVILPGLGASRRRLVLAGH